MLKYELLDVTREPVHVILDVADILTEVPILVYDPLTQASDYEHSVLWAIIHTTLGPFGSIGNPTNMVRMILGMRNRILEGHRPKIIEGHHYVPLVEAHQREVGRRRSEEIAQAKKAGGKIIID